MLISFQLPFLSILFFRTFFFPLCPMHAQQKIDFVVSFDLRSLQCFFFFFSFNFGMLLKWRSSIRLISRIWQQENTKVKRKSIILLYFWLTAGIQDYNGVPAGYFQKFRIESGDFIFKFFFFIIWLTIFLKTQKIANLKNKSPFGEISEK